MKECMQFLLLVPMIFIVVFVSIAIPVVFIDKHSCSTYADVTGRTTTYKFTTCYVDSGNGFIPRKEFELRAVSKEK